MAQTALSNVIDGTVDVYEKKYLRYLGGARQDLPAIVDIFKSKDVNKIESALVSLADGMRSTLFVIGMGCVIIDREQLYIDAGYRNYFEYAIHLCENIKIAPSTISTAKIIMERYIDFNKELTKHRFEFDNNSHKLLFLETALQNHENRNEVFRRICADTLRGFQEWARSSDKPAELPPPQPKITIENGQIFIDGKGFLRFASEFFLCVQTE